MKIENVEFASLGGGTVTENEPGKNVRLVAEQFQLRIDIIDEDTDIIKTILTKDGNLVFIDILTNRFIKYCYTYL